MTCWIASLTSFSDLGHALAKYCSSHEEVLEWLLDVEDRLKTMGKVSENLDQIKIQFQVHGDYMQYLDSNQEEIGKVNVFLNQAFDTISWDILTHSNFGTKSF